jgi:nucleoside-diphosphate-sugar epimerase
MLILVTGASGYIGKRLIPVLHDNDFEIVTLTRNKIPESTALKSIAGDLCDASCYQQLPTKIDVVIHLAQSRLYQNQQANMDLFNVNTMSTMYLLEYARAAGAQYFCYLSTGSVYSSIPQPLDEMLPLAPESMLGATKYAAEVLVNAYKKYFKTVVLRLFTPYGPQQENRIIPKLFDSIEKGLPITIAGPDEGTVLSNIYIDDLLGIITESVKAQWTGNINVAHPQALSIAQMSQAIALLLGKDVILQRNLEDKACHFIADVKKLSSLYPLQDLTAFSEGIRRCKESSHGNNASY